MSAHTKVPYVKSLMFCFKHTSPILTVGRESIKENCFCKSTFTANTELACSQLEKKGPYLYLVRVNFHAMGQSLFHMLGVKVAQAQSTHSLIFNKMV